MEFFDAGAAGRLARDGISRLADSFSSLASEEYRGFVKKIIDSKIESKRVLMTTPLTEGPARKWFSDEFPTISRRRFVPDASRNHEWELVIPGETENDMRSRYEAEVSRALWEDPLRATDIRNWFAITYRSAKRPAFPKKIPFELEYDVRRSWEGVVQAHTADRILRSALEHTERHFARGGTLESLLAQSPKKSFYSGVGSEIHHREFTDAMSRILKTHWDEFLQETGPGGRFEKLVEEQRRSVLDGPFFDQRVSDEMKNHKFQKLDYEKSRAALLASMSRKTEELMESVVFNTELPVAAVRVLRPDLASRQEMFTENIEVFSTMSHSAKPGFQNRSKWLLNELQKENSDPADMVAASRSFVGNGRVIPSSPRWCSGANMKTDGVSAPVASLRLAYLIASETVWRAP